MAVLASAVFVTAILGVMAQAQVGKSLGVIDVNTATEKDLLALPHMTPEIVKTIVDTRPFESAMAFNTHLLAQKLTPEYASEFYGKAFVHINLNTATPEEIKLIPGAGKKMAKEFEEYRPWKSWAQFNKKISKYVGEKEVERLAQYCFIPLDVNKATDEELATIPGVTKPTLEQISKGRPWKTMEDFKKDFAKTAGDKDARRIARFLVAE
jgi:DNA uptake protein ComE-like DNA-binding protein